MAADRRARSPRSPGPGGAAAGGREPLERLLSKRRLASRTEAQRLIRAGRVTVGGQVVTDPRRFVPRDAPLAVDGAAAPAASTGPATWVLLNKPRGAVSTTKDPQGRPTVMDLVTAFAAPGLAPVGRLDQASAGLLLLTNDSALAARLLDPASHVPKTYRVKVRGHLAEAALQSLRTETVEEPLPGGTVVALGPMQVEVESVGPRSTWLVVTLREGKNRQIRRRLEALGHAVEVLVRTRFGPLELGDLAPGAARALTPAEVERLARAAAARPAG